ncbi:hypothetical protein JRO89_XS15G0150400 [Xanthoceras sorbifolium]|uniref:AP-5 complex subunit zeta-1 n=1 Tax=Xanthoceras sorbifolium TaxID=99658 RepID=A0ABQ8H299_9ROSI|nr:hypothetical protein JRO89_XS15G0150400 [Xanthoceras sorbifolium]
MVSRNENIWDRNITAEGELIDGRCGGLIWIKYEPFKNCHPQPNPLYNSQASSTYRKLACDHPLCSGPISFTLMLTGNSSVESQMAVEVHAIQTFGFEERNSVVKLSSDFLLIDSRQIPSSKTLPTPKKKRKMSWDFHLRTLSNSARDSNLATDPASDPSLLQSVKKLYELCKEEKNEDLVARVYPHINKLFQRSVASVSQSGTSNGLLLLAILQFFLDFGEVVLHDADPSLRTFFRSCLSREFADPVVAEATLDFLNSNKKKLLSSFPALLPQFFPLLLKLIAWNGEKLEKAFLRVFPALMSPASFLPLLSSLLDLPRVAIGGHRAEIFVILMFCPDPYYYVRFLGVALEKVERSSGSLIGSSIASIQKSTAPEMLLALMDEAYTGSTIADGGADSESEDSSTIDVADPLFLELLKDENDGLALVLITIYLVLGFTGFALSTRTFCFPLEAAERHWTSPGMATTLQAVFNTSRSDRMKQILNMTPRLLDMYFAIALRGVNDCIFNMCIDSPDYDKTFHTVRKRLLEFMLAAFQRSPDFVALLKIFLLDISEVYSCRWLQSSLTLLQKPIMDRLGEAYDSPVKMELALQLCWAIGEHGGGGASHKDAARELFENLELLLYENLSSSRLGLMQEAGRGSYSENYRKSSQSRLLCFVVTAIAKLATYHRELLPRARVSLGKVARSRISDVRVWKRARDYLGLMNEPAICLSVLGPSRPSRGVVQNPGTINWSEGGTKMVAHAPFYILGAQEGPPFHDFTFSDVIPRR